ncbi:MAG: 30S ribosomal protein S1 [Thermaerobacterales bacterium]
MEDNKQKNQDVPGQEAVRRQDEAVETPEAEAETEAAVTQEAAATEERRADDGAEAEDAPESQPTGEQPAVDAPETTDEAGPPPGAASEADSEAEPAENTQDADTGNEAPSEVQAGDILKGTIVQIHDDHMLVDVGYKADGLIPLSEMTLGPGQSPASRFEAGQELYVHVLSVDQRDGALLLSERRARAERVWTDLEEALEQETMMTAPVVEQVKGGLVVDVGVRAFMPASHVERGYVSDLSVYVGNNVRARVIELDRTKNRVILSQKKVLEEEYQEQRVQTWEELDEGQVRTGTVKGITDFGAFIDLGGVDGLLHVSEMAWGRVEHPADVVQEGEEIQVKVLRVDRDRERISLGLKQILPDPWEAVEERYPVESIIDGKVMRIAPFGAFVQLEPGVEGLVHISELANYHVQTADEVISEGETIPVKVLRVQADDRRISLSLKDARPDLEHFEENGSAPQSEYSENAAGGAAKRAPSSRPAPRPGPAQRRPQQRKAQPKRNGAGGRPNQAERDQRAIAEEDRSSGQRDAITLGDMFGDLLGETRDRLEQEEKQAAKTAKAGDDADDSESGGELERDAASAQADTTGAETEKVSYKAPDTEEQESDDDSVEAGEDDEERRA